MENPQITCPCKQNFTEDLFIRHYTKCDAFRGYFSEFDSKFGMLLKSYATEVENMLILRVLLKQYTVVIEKKIKAQTGCSFNNDVNKNNTQPSFPSNPIKNQPVYQNNNIKDPQEIINSNFNDEINMNKPVRNPQPIDLNKNYSNNSNYNNNFSNSSQHKNPYEGRFHQEDIVVCQMCSDPNIQYLECMHEICFNCIMKLIEKDIFNVKCQKCDCSVDPFYIKQLIGDDKFAMYENNSLQKHLVNSIKCANQACKQPILFEKGSINYNEKDEKGNKLSAKACEDFANQRCRCPSCKTEFCVDCLSMPYHLGKSCAEQKVYLSAKKCKFCDVVVTLSNKGPSNSCCNNSECSTRYNESCKKVLACGHDCPGHSKESKCLPCLDSNCKNYNDQYDQDLESYCAICYSESIGSAPNVKLDCGHIFHHHCIVERLHKKWIGPEINLKFIKCISCNAWLSSPNNTDIQLVISPFLDLNKKIIEMTTERIKFEGLDKDKRVKDPNDKYYNKPLEYGLDKIQYYMCYKCKKPYFAGLKECGAQNDREHDAKDLLCGSCGALDGVAGISECKKHGKEFIEYKCKFCCNISSWFCWGTTHFCESCHSRQCKHDYVTKIPKDKLPKCLGQDKCDLKINHPANGEEFALGCSICRNEVANQRNF